MGAAMIDAVLFGKTRAAVLRELYVNPDRRISFNALVRRIKSGPGAVSRELATLIDAGLIAEEREGNQRFLCARSGAPLFPELRALISKASGAPSLLRDALQGLESAIDVAIIFGSVATGTEHADSDLDFFVAGTAGYSVVTQRIHSIEERLGRRVQLQYFDVSSATDRVSLQRSSTRAMLSGSKVFVLGDEVRLEALLKTNGVPDGQKNKPRKSHKGDKARITRR
jgi:predicted nucleotidyltransferase/DNA-binding transcriptional ArsR family regulator